MKYLQILWNGFWRFLFFSCMIGLVLALSGVTTNLITPIAFTLGGVFAVLLTCIEIIRALSGEEESG